MIISDDVYFTEVMTEVRVSERSGLDMGGTPDRRCDTPMNTAMEMAMAVTSIGRETAGQDTLETTEKNGNGMRRRRSQVPATPLVLRDWRSHIEPVAHQQHRNQTQNPRRT
jgi:hypothetical protein